MTFSLSGGEKNDSPEGMKLLNFTPLVEENEYLLMDRAYQGDNMRLIAKELGYETIVPPKSNRLHKCFMTENSINAEMRLNAFFVVLNVSEEFLLDMISWI